MPSRLFHAGLPQFSDMFAFPPRLYVPRVTSRWRYSYIFRNRSFTWHYHSPLEQTSATRTRILQKKDTMPSLGSALCVSGDSTESTVGAPISAGSVAAGSDATHKNTGEPTSDESDNRAPSVDQPVNCQQTAKWPLSL